MKLGYNKFGKIQKKFINFDIMFNNRWNNNMGCITLVWINITLELRSSL